MENLLFLKWRKSSLVILYHVICLSLWLIGQNRHSTQLNCQYPFHSYLESAELVFSMQLDLKQVNMRHWATTLSFSSKDYQSMEQQSTLGKVDSCPGFPESIVNSDQYMHMWVLFCFALLDVNGTILHMWLCNFFFLIDLRNFH